LVDAGDRVPLHAGWCGGTNIRQIEPTEFVRRSTNGCCSCPVVRTEANDIASDSERASIAEVQASIYGDAGITQGRASEGARRGLEDPIIGDCPVVVIGLDADT
jgi:hypothetical protein